MEKQIKELVELATEIRDWGREIELPNKHNLITKDSLPMERISIYFSDRREVSAVNLGEYPGPVYVVFYANKIELPLNATAEYLDQLLVASRGSFAKVKETLTKQLTEDAKEESARRAEELVAELVQMGFTVEKKA